MPLIVNENKGAALSSLIDEGVDKKEEFTNCYTSTSCMGSFTCPACVCPVNSLSQEKQPWARFLLVHIALMCHKQHYGWVIRAYIVNTGNLWCHMTYNVYYKNI